MSDLKELEQKLGYHFHNAALLRQALSHSSYINEHHMEKTDCNERLEFLGDAVLELISSDFLYHTYPEKPEGDLSRTRASLVCEPTLAFCAEVFPLGDYLLLGRGEEATGGRRRNSVVSDALEAVIGAIYLDGGFTSAKEFVLRFVLNDLEHKKLFYDSKTILQEMVQKDGGVLTYEELGESGPAHQRVFAARAMVGDREIGRGEGHSKKAAEAMAAYQGILKLQEEQTCI